MEPLRQRTIRRDAALEGVGLHTGQAVRIRFRPAEADHGIRFVRADLEGRPEIPVTPATILDLPRRPRRTSVGAGAAEVHTIEHLMATCYGLGVTNLLVEITGEEVPGLDGSAFPFLETLKYAGVVEQDAVRQPLAVKDPIWAEEGSATLLVVPSEEFRISYTMSYPHPALNAQFFSRENPQPVFEQELAPSRTFCMADEVDALRRQGMGKGATYENTVVVGPQGVINNRLRFPDEFVRHKVLDLLGDLYILGRPIQGHVIAVRSGHSLNLKLVQRLRQAADRGFEGGIPAIHVEPGAAHLDSTMIQRILPHRYPFLMVDRIVHLEDDVRAVGVKSVTINEPFFSGHFPGRPVMPGVMILEALAQVAGILMLNKRENLGKFAYFVAIDGVKFRRTVLPGDQLVLEAEILKLRSKTGQMRTRALVDGKIVTEADLMFALVEGNGAPPV
ncbi:MAG: UDP-3-O-[3-hydroxymyristoyl] N-acetylglucosamine deacetylase [Candidatus Omnitrophica bacterium]|nr:UDP-3-O-[3-hydroxymyristoyl] N-acetylglucosamine deacetylase [Candidatus Omnitrophota bacterium]